MAMETKQEEGHTWSRSMSEEGEGGAAQEGEREASDMTCSERGDQAGRHGAHGSQN